MCMRVKEMDQLQICDVLWHFDAAFHIMYAQTLACRTCKRTSSTTPTAVQPRHRNDSKSAAKHPPGHGPRPPRLGTRDRQPALKTRPARPPGLIFRAATAARPRLGGGEDLRSRRLIANGVATTDPMSRQQVTNAVLETLASIGVDNTNYSGISMRRGGISAGLAARVPEPILFLQSGHGSNCAARNYMVPRDPHVLYETYLAFGLQL